MYMDMYITHAQVATAKTAITLIQSATRAKNARARVDTMRAGGNITGAGIGAGVSARPLLDQAGRSNRPRGSSFAAKSRAQRHSSEVTVHSAGVTAHSAPLLRSDEAASDAKFTQAIIRRLDETALPRPVGLPKPGTGSPPSTSLGGFQPITESPASPSSLEMGGASAETADAQVHSFPARHPRVPAITLPPLQPAAGSRRLSAESNVVRPKPKLSRSSTAPNVSSSLGRRTDPSTSHPPPSPPRSPHLPHLPPPTPPTSHTSHPSPPTNQVTAALGAPPAFDMFAMASSMFDAGSSGQAAAQPSARQYSMSSHDDTQYASNDSQTQEAAPTHDQTQAAALTDGQTQEAAPTHDQTQEAASNDGQTQYMI